MKNKVKELRVKIDGLSQLVKGLKPISKYTHNRKAANKQINVYLMINSDEINKAYDSLILAKAWLGKVLGELGESTPYTNDGKRKTVEDIQPTADTHRGITHLTTEGNWNTDYNHIEKVDWLREEIKEINDKVKEQLHFVESERMLLLERVEQHLSEARFWLGFELQRIKES
jgi:hypothetical protein